MAQPPDDRWPRDYDEMCRFESLAWAQYRRVAKYPGWNHIEIRQTADWWRATTVPRALMPMFRGVNRDWNDKKGVYHTFEDRTKPNLSSFTRTDDDLTEQAKLRYWDAKWYFGEHPAFAFQKSLGFGGLGLALHYKYLATNRDIVVKLGLKDWDSSVIRSELKATRAMARAAHCIQMIEPQALYLPPPPELQHPKPLLDDSSEEEESSGDESSNEVRPPRKRRRDITSAEIAQKKESYDRRRLAWELDIYRQGPFTSHRKDYLILEYVSGGNLENLIFKLVRARSADRPTLIPNRVLWALWLCLIRACVAMKYPPRKFHPDRPKASNPNGSNDLIEIVPPLDKRWRAKNMTHFDIDPTNIFIGDIDPPQSNTPVDPIVPGGMPLKKRRADREPDEHVFVPRLKLADFGLAQNIKRNKRNEYYQRRRMTGKNGFFAPEQFGTEWDRIPGVADGPEVSERTVAGYYGSATNVWGMALTMWIIITQTEIPRPPQPQVPEGVNIPPQVKGQPPVDIDAEIRKQAPMARISYCPLLMDGSYNHVDEELRRAIYESMYHRPLDRPRVETLLAQARRGIQKRYATETDDAVKSWIDRFMNSADH
ncbi:kinase-like protein [Jackrogersella minutella]|nr:kinase-like protein [Jackrogersella minutella]